MNLREIDRLIAEKVMGWTELLTSRGQLVGTPLGTVVPRNVPEYSSDPAAAKQLMIKIAELVGEDADGFFYLEYSDSADMTTGDRKRCKVQDTTPKYPADYDGPDLAPWACHLHPFFAAENTPPNWDSEWFCNRAATPELALCLASLKAFNVEIPE